MKINQEKVENLFHAMSEVNGSELCTAICMFDLSTISLLNQITAEIVYKNIKNNQELSIK